jgi:hypothetical protein
VLTAVVVASGAGCGSGMQQAPTQYLSFMYTITPPGTGATDQPLMLAIAPESTICDKGNKKIELFASQGVASATISLTGTATSPNQTSLAVDYQTVGIAQVDMQLPLAFDSMGVGRNPVGFTTSDQNQGLSCNFNLPVADYFTMMNGTFTCTSSQTGMPRRIDLTGGTIVATPCGTPPSM